MLADSDCSFLPIPATGFQMLSGYPRESRAGRALDVEAVQAFVCKSFRP